MSEDDTFQAQSDKESEEGEISDAEVQEKNEEMNYRETVRAVRAFLGFTQIPDFEASTGDYDCSDNPWKGKHPWKSGKVSLELPADDWLCHKIEKLNVRAAEGSLSLSQESAGLKQDQFIRTPKIQAKWYRQSCLRPEDPQCPRRSVFSWSDSEARLNAQFSFSGYANPVRNKHLKESQAVEKVVVPSSLASYNRLFLVPKPNNKWRPILDLSQLNLYLASASFKMETPKTIRLSLQQGEWVTSLDFSDSYFHVPISKRSRKFLRFHLNSQTYQFTALLFCLSTAPLEFTKVAKEVKLMAQAQGIRIHQYLDNRLLRALCPEMCQRHTQTLLDLLRSRVGSQSFKVGTGSTTGFQLCQLSFRPLSRSGQTHSGEVDSSVPENQSSFGTGDLLDQAVHVLNRTSDSHRKASGVGTPAYEAYSVAFKEALACPRSPGKDHSPAKVSPSSSEVVVGPKQGSERPTFTPLTTHPPSVYRRLKRRLGRTLRRLHCKRPLVQTTRRLAHKFARTQSGLLVLKQFEHLFWDQTILVCTDNTTVVSYINKEGSMKLGSLCALLWRLLLWCNQRQIVFWARHIPGHLNVIADKLSRHKQVIQTEWSLLQEVFLPTLPEVAQTGGGSICNQIQSQTSQVCIAGTRPVGLEGRCINSSVGEAGR